MGSSSANSEHEIRVIVVDEHTYRTTLRVGFGYVTNMLGVHLHIDPRAQRLIEALYASL